MRVGTTTTWRHASISRDLQTATDAATRRGAKFTLEALEIGRKVTRNLGRSEEWRFCAWQTLWGSPSKDVERAGTRRGTMLPGNVGVFSAVGAYDDPARTAPVLYTAGFNHSD